MSHLGSSTVTDAHGAGLTEQCVCKLMIRPNCCSSLALAFWAMLVRSSKLSENQGGTVRLCFFCEVQRLGGSSYVRAGAMPRARDQLGTLVRHVEGLVTLSFLNGRSCNPIFAPYTKYARFNRPICCPYRALGTSALLYFSHIPHLWGLLRLHWYSLTFWKNQRINGQSEQETEVVHSVPQQTFRWFWCICQHCWSTTCWEAQWPLDLLPALLHNISKRRRWGCCVAQIQMKYSNARYIWPIYITAQTASRGWHERRLEQTRVSAHTLAHNYASAHSPGQRERASLTSIWKSCLSPPKQRHTDHASNGSPPVSNAIAPPNGPKQRANLSTDW